MITRTSFGFLSSGPDTGREVHLFTLKSDNNPLTVVLSDYGARIYDLTLDLSDGSTRGLVAGFKTIADYEAHSYFGATIGRVGNRIAKGSFSLDGKEYSLFVNNGENTLHGGRFGFDTYIWDSRVNDGEEPSVTFRRLSPDGEEGFPGNLNVSVTFTLTKDSGINISYSAETDAATILNLTNHVYFNFMEKGTAVGHVVTGDMTAYLPTDAGLIPTGEIRPVDGTVFDFRQPRTIASAAESDDADILTAGGIDHCFVFPEADGSFRDRIKAVSPDGKVEMHVLTDRPGVQFYSGNFLSEEDTPMKHGPQINRGGFCFETQGFPDAVNQPGFPSVVLRPGEKFTSETRYTFKAL